jgi:nucleoside-diphosphate-sugar epimerase
MMSSRRVLITGAAGNLGSRLARRLAGDVELVRAMIHRRPLPDALAFTPAVEAAQADLARPETLPRCLDGVDTIVHFAGVLFRARPERFLPQTNIRWFSNLLDAALAARISRVILISFPHVEGPTTREHPATDRLDGQPISVHARTRLEEVIGFVGAPIFGFGVILKCWRIQSNCARKFNLPPGVPKPTKPTS